MLTNNTEWKKQASAMLAEKEAEIAFMKMATKSIEAKAAPIMQSPYCLGFEIVYTNSKKDKMIGIFGCRLNKQLLYIPVFYINGALKNTDLLYLQNEKQFVLLSPEWCDYLIGKYIITQGKPIKAEAENGATQEIDMKWLVEPPMHKSASERIPLGHTFGFYEGDVSEDDAKKAFDTYFHKEASEPNKHLLKKFIDREGYSAFEKIASAVYNDYEFANNLIRFVEEDDWLIPEYLDFSKKTAEVKPEVVKQASAADLKTEEIFNAKNCILVHKGKFNPYAKVASEQIENGYSIEDRRDQDKLDVVYKSNQNEFRTFDNNTAGVYSVLGCDGTTKDFLVLTGMSDGGKQPALMVDIATREVLVAKDTRNPNDTQQLSYESHGPSGIDLDKIYNQIMAKPLDDKNIEDYLTEKPTVGKVYGIYSANEGYISDECFYIKEHYKDEDVDVYRVIPFLDYVECPKSFIDDDAGKFMVRINPDALQTNLRNKTFRPEDIRWVEVKVTSDQDNSVTIEVEEDDKETLTPTKYTVVKSEFVPGTLQDYDLGLSDKHNIDKSKVEKTVDAEYLVNIAGKEKSEPVSKIAATVKLMHDFNISEASAKEILDEADKNDVVRFYHKKVATRMTLRPEPEFYESLDPDLGINVFQNDTKIVPVDQSNDEIPNIRYGDSVKLDGVENHAAEGKPQETVNKNHDEEGGNDILLTATPNMLAQIAEKTGNKNIFEHGIISTLATTYDASMYISQFLGDLRSGLDKLGRLLFLYYWKPADFTVYYGSDDLMELDAKLSSTFRQLGEVILDLSLRTKDDPINNASNTVD